MNSRIKKLVGGALLVGALIIFYSPKVYAFGETGCIRNPENEVGTCQKNTEGIWKCVPTSPAVDCTESGD